MKKTAKNLVCLLCAVSLALLCTPFTAYADAYLSIEQDCPDAEEELTGVYAYCDELLLEGINKRNVYLNADWGRNWRVVSCSRANCFYSAMAAEQIADLSAGYKQVKFALADVDGEKEQFSRAFYSYQADNLIVASPQSQNKYVYDSWCWKMYARSGGTSSSVTLPVIFIINPDNKIVCCTTGPVDVESLLKKYIMTDTSNNKPLTGAVGTAAHLKMLSSDRPLQEFDDPTYVSGKFATSSSGIIQAFLAEYGDFRSEDDIEIAVYEKALLKLMGNEAWIGMFDDLDSVTAAASEVLNQAAQYVSTAAASTAASASGDAVSMLIAAIDDSVKLTVRKDAAKLGVLKIIEAKTSDRNLRTACTNIENAVFSNTVNAVSKAASLAVSELGWKAISAAFLKAAPVFTKGIGKGFEVLGSAAGVVGSSFNAVGAVLTCVDFAASKSGMDDRWESFVMVGSICSINDALYSAYGDCKHGNLLSTTEGAQEFVGLFDCITTSKQIQYEAMAGMFTNKTWQKCLAADSKLKKNCSVIKTINSSTYSSDLHAGRLVPALSTKAKITVKKGSKKNIKPKNLAYFSSVSYSTSKKSVATVANDGTLKANSKGTAVITIKVRQYNSSPRTLKTTVKVS